MAVGNLLDKQCLILHIVFHIFRDFPGFILDLAQDQWMNEWIVLIIILGCTHSTHSIIVSLFILIVNSQPLSLLDSPASERNEIVNKHIELRKSVWSPASNMLQNKI